MNTDEHSLHDLESEKEIKEIVEKHGWFVALMEETDYLPAFGYTIGLWKNYKHPELICLGLNPKTIHLLLNIAGEKIKNGEKIQTNHAYDDFLENHSAKFLNVNNSFLRDYFGYAIWFNNRKDFDAMQLVWPNENNVFPWETGFPESQKFNQPLLDRNIDFKFLETKDNAIFTNKQLLTENKPIVSVSHNDDGSWEFYTDDEISEEIIKIISIEEIVKRDATLNELFNLDYGEHAKREYIGSPWIRNSSNQ